MNFDSNKAADCIIESKSMIVFTGAGISVESGIPPFRGTNGLWAKYDPICLDLQYFQSNPLESWKAIKSIFYDFFGSAHFNKAHEILARFEKKNIIKAVITQNIDNLHQEAGSQNVIEFHGNSQQLICEACGHSYLPADVNLNHLPPLCSKDQQVLKPNFVFFGEGVPEEAFQKSMDLARETDLVLIIGTTGETMPAAMIPTEAKRNGASIIEINIEKSNYTNTISDFFLQGEASEILMRIEKLIS